MSDGLTDVPEPLAGISTNGTAEPAHAIEIDPDSKPGHQKSSTTTQSNWLNHSEKQQQQERPKQMQGKIHRVPYLLRENSKPKDNYYQPKVVSIGPYHFDKANPKISKEDKRSMADRLVPDKAVETSMRCEIGKNIESLMGAYSSDKMKTEALSKWEEMFFLDGCFVLHFIFCILFHRVEDLKMKWYDMDSVRNDLFLAENQLPFKLLQILSGNDPKLLYYIDLYIYTHKISKGIDCVWRQDKPVHLLDRLRTIIIGSGSDTQKSQQGTWEPWEWELTPPRNAKELTARGIHLKPNRTGFLKDIFFRSHFIYGTLRLPRIIVDNSTRLLFLNLAAYEMHAADLDSAISSYICFLDSLVNQADDIKELQSAGILVNHLATDEAAANLFNEMSQGLHLHPDEDTHTDVKWKIQKFFEHKTKASIALWVAECYHKHFKSPLTAMAVLAAFLALGLGATQTYFTIYPSGNN